MGRRYSRRPISYGDSMSYILVLFLYAGVMSKGDSVALTSVPGFASEAACREAGRQSMTLVERTFKDARFVCVKAQ